MPLKKLTRKEIKLKEKPWMNSEIRSQMRERDKTRKKILRSKNKEKREEHILKFKELRNKIVALCRTSTQITLITLNRRGKVLDPLSILNLLQNLYQRH